ncbi:hypothetical protein TrCOL_g1546 [Triparma columacea]|uniref:Uncharacterized protein n=1 Tax=Triparma columacea TaxID=722753 RepID=A0A9W7L7C6_9STRA|nr:hypothetical protein TrCOL_g1546 [Triparma columacea]
MSRETRLNRLLHRIQTLEENLGLNRSTTSDSSIDNRLKTLENSEGVLKCEGKEIRKGWQDVNQHLKDMEGLEGRGEEGVEDMMEVVVSCEEDYSALLSDLSSLKSSYSSGKTLNDEQRFSLSSSQISRLRNLQDEVVKLVERKERVEERTDKLVETHFKLVRGVNEGIGGIMG